MPRKKAPTPAVRDKLGRFIRGESGNPDGPKVGTRTFNKRLQLAMEGALRAYLAEPEQAEQLQKALDRVLKIAASTDDDKVAVAAFKVITDKLMAVPRPAEDPQSGVSSLTILIENNTAMSSDDNGSAVTLVGDYEELED